MSEFRTAIPLDKNKSKSFFDSIDFSPLQEYVKSNYGIESDIECYLKYNIPCILWKEELKNRCGILGLVAKSIKLERVDCRLRVPFDCNAKKKANFSCKGIFNPADKDIDAKYGEPYLKGTVCLCCETERPEHFILPLFGAKYTESKGWEFTAPTPLDH